MRRMGAEAGSIATTPLVNQVLKERIFAFPDGRDMPGLATAVRDTVLQAFGVRSRSALPPEPSADGWLSICLQTEPRSTGRPTGMRWQGRP